MGSDRREQRDDPPKCPACGRPMRASEILPATKVHPSVRKFRCEGCGIETAVMID